MTIRRSQHGGRLAPKIRTAPARSISFRPRATCRRFCPPPSAAHDRTGKPPTPERGGDRTAEQAASDDADHLKRQRFGIRMGHSDRSLEELRQIRDRPRRGLNPSGAIVSPIVLTVSSGRTLSPGQFVRRTFASAANVIRVRTTETPKTTNKVRQRCEVVACFIDSDLSNTKSPPPMRPAPAPMGSGAKARRQGQDRRSRRMPLTQGKTGRPFRSVLWRRSCPSRSLRNLVVVAARNRAGIIHSLIPPRRSTRTPDRDTTHTRQVSRPELNSWGEPRTV